MFPTTPGIDAFNRANESPLSDGGRWEPVGANPSMELESNVARGTNIGAVDAGVMYREDTDLYGPDAEAYVTVAAVGGALHNVELHARVAIIEDTTYSSYMVQYRKTQANVRIARVTAGVSVVLATSGSITLADGDKLGVEVVGSTINAYVFQSGAWSLATTATDSTFTDAGFLMMLLLDTAHTLRVDDFGGGTKSIEPQLAAVRAELAEVAPRLLTTPRRSLAIALSTLDAL